MHKLYNRLYNIEHYITWYFLQKKLKNNRKRRNINSGIRVFTNTLRGFVKLIASVTSTGGIVTAEMFTFQSVTNAAYTANTVRHLQQDFYYGEFLCIRSLHVFL